MSDAELNKALYDEDRSTPEPKRWYWGRDYGKDLLEDINQLAHYRGTGCIHRDCLQRAHREIRRLRNAINQQLKQED